MVFLSHGVSAFGLFGVGVDLFFVLSGFLIGRIYFRSKADGTFSLWRFWQMRWWRTLPPYYAALIVFWLASLHFPGNNIHWYYVFFLQNYVGVDGFGPSWSLCVEEHFYLLLPLLGGIVGRLFGTRSFLWLLPIASLVPMALRFAFLLSPQGLPPNWYWMTHFHSEGLTLGVLLAFLFVHHRSAWDKLRPYAMALACLPWVMLAIIMVHPIPNVKFNAVLFLIYALGFAGFLRVSYDIQWSPVMAPLRLAKRAIQGLALSAYSIYLVHVLFFTDVRQLIGNWQRGPIKSGVILCCALLAGVLFYFMFEKPSIDMRDRYVKRRRAADAKLPTVSHAS